MNTPVHKYNNVQATEAELLDHLSRDFDKEGFLFKTGPSPKVNSFPSQHGFKSE
jgi:hypothetical protein